MAIRPISARVLRHTTPKHPALVATSRAAVELSTSRVGFVRVAVVGHTRERIGIVGITRQGFVPANQSHTTIATPVQVHLR